jgi:hypothetical protein
MCAERPPLRFSILRVLCLLALATGLGCQGMNPTRSFSCGAGKPTLDQFQEAVLAAGFRSISSPSLGMDHPSGSKLVAIFVSSEFSTLHVEVYRWDREDRNYIIVREGAVGGDKFSPGALPVIERLRISLAQRAAGGCVELVRKQGASVPVFS